MKWEDNGARYHSYKDLTVWAKQEARLNERTDRQPHLIMVPQLLVKRIDLIYCGYHGSSSAQEKSALLGIFYLSAGDLGRQNCGSLAARLQDRLHLEWQLRQYEK